MPYRRFLLYNALGGGAWAAALVLLGYFLGESWSVAERWIGRVGLVIAVIVIAAIAWWLHRARQRQGAKPATPA